MKLTKSIITILLLLFVAATVGTLIAQEVARPKVQVAEANESVLAVEPNVPVTSEPVTSEQEPVINESAVADETERPEADALDETSVTEKIGESPTVESPLTEAPCMIEAIYFHNTYRCVTCVKIEDKAKAIVEAEFADELAAGTLRWLAINMDEERTYISLYDLAMPSLVLIRKVGDEVVDWTTLSDTWSKIRSSTRFSAYIIDSFQEFMEESL
ncbi:hypothetical protein KAH43_07745 [Candidatus Bipolaricaulota bacterium]|nr:hypothetical protein [Candidatus Bipolaricaulota bacterium]